MDLRVCACNTGPDTHLLDHIAPIASFLSIPLIVTEEENASIASQFYPEVEVRFWPDFDFRLQEIAEEFDALIECKFWLPQLKQVMLFHYNKQLRLIFCPHGQSDKGYQQPLLAPYATQDGVLLYGDLLHEMLVELDVWDSIPAHARVGNYRLRYHEKHRERQRQLAERDVFSTLNPMNRTLLYAPTWRDADGSTTFFSAVEKLIEELPSSWNLIIKIHPLLPQRDPALYYRIAAIEEKRANLVVLLEFPLIYPILERIHAYLGDYSSIGYDVLAFEKPMFFFHLPSLSTPRLHQCGQVIDWRGNIFQSIEDGLRRAPDFIPIQKALYKKAFDSVDDLEGAIGKIMNLSAK